MRSFITSLLAIASVTISGCSGELTDSAPDSNADEEVGEAAQALSLPSAPTISAPASNQVVSKSNVMLMWSPISDATQYRVQITRAGSFSGDTCTAPCELEAVVLSSNICNASYCVGYYNDSGISPTARKLRIRGGKTGVGGAWSAVRSYTVY